MKIKIAINYDDIKKEEVIVLVNLPENKCKEILTEFFSKMKYKQRRKWLKNNLTEIDVYRLDNPDEHNNE
jgi:hypothetical protein|tara:strand:- start:127 stop:336 length:210 start_codon:yes stop_codon:yes gene_type:complete